MPSYLYLFISLYYCNETRGKNVSNSVDNMCKMLENVTSPASVQQVWMEWAWPHTRGGPTGAILPCWLGHAGGHAQMEKIGDS